MGVVIAVAVLGTFVFLWADSVRISLNRMADELERRRLDREDAER